MYSKTACRQWEPQFHALIINISRQGLIYIPLLYVMNSILGVNGLLWAQPVADVLSLILAVILYYVAYGRKIRQTKEVIGGL